MVGKQVEAGGASVRLTLRDQLKAGLVKAHRQLSEFANRAGAIGTRAILGATAIAIPLGGAVKAFASFDDQMRTVGAVTKATAQQMEQMTAKALELGRTTSFTAKEVAEAMINLGRLGFSPEEIDQSIAGVLDLARATDTDLAQATQIAGDIMRSFRIQTSETGRVMDVLTATANGSSQTLVDLFESMKLLGPITAEAGDSFESTAAAIGILANNGIKGSLAGNALGRAYKNLANERIQEKLFKETGVQAIDAAGNLRPMVEIMRDLGAAIESMPEAQRLSIFEEIFGRGSLAATTMARSNQDIVTMTDALLNIQGAARRTASEMDAGLGGAFRNLESAAEGVVLAIGQALDPVINALGRAVIPIVESIAGWIEQHRELVIALTAGVAVVGTFGAALLGIAVAAKTAAFAISGIAIALGVVKVAFAAMTAVVGGAGAILGALIAGGPVTLLVAGIGALAAILGHATGAFSGLGAMAASVAAGFRDLVGRVMDTFGSIREALSAGDLALAARILWLAIQAEWSRGTAFVLGIWDGFVTTLKNVFTGVTTGIADVFLGTMGIISRAIQAAINLVNKLPGVEIDADVVFDSQEASRLLRDDAQREINQRLAEQQGRAVQRNTRTAELEAALARAKAEAAAAAESAKATAVETDAKIEQQRQAVEQAARQAPSAVRELSGAGGTFSSFAAQRLSGEQTTIARKTLEAIEGVEQNTEDLLHEIRDGLFAFS